MLFSGFISGFSELSAGIDFSSFSQSVLALYAHKNYVGTLIFDQLHCKIILLHITKGKHSHTQHVKPLDATFRPRTLKDE